MPVGIRPRAIGRAIGALAAGLTLSVALGGTASASYPACFGAAARDAAHPCSNPRLRLSVLPTPSEAQITPNASCRPIEPKINVCGFGAPAVSARGTIGLVGNSHASHWRAALQVLAKSLDLRGQSITRSSCPFTRATVNLAEPKRAQCTWWHREVVKWLRQHPEVSTLFVSDQPTSAVVPAGQSGLAVEVGGYIAAWTELPATIKHIIVIRDNPYALGGTSACIEEAIARREPAGPPCALPRSHALKVDPAALAAERLHSARVQVIDLTRFFCDSQLCYPVIGGALVYKDSDHLTRVFAATLGPFLLREFRRLMRTWPKG